MKDIRVTIRFCLPEIKSDSDSIKNVAEILLNDGVYTVDIEDVHELTVNLR